MKRVGLSAFAMLGCFALVAFAFLGVPNDAEARGHSLSGFRGGFGGGGLRINIGGPRVVAVPVQEVQAVQAVAPGLRVHAPGVHLEVGNRFNHQLLNVQNQRLNQLNTFGLSTNSVANIGYNHANFQLLHAAPIYASPIVQQYAYQVPPQVIPVTPVDPAQLQLPTAPQALQAPTCQGACPAPAAALVNPGVQYLQTLPVNPGFRLQFRSGGHY